MIAIHYSEDDIYCKVWIRYCENEKIPYKIVDCLSSDILNDLEGCTALLWHWHHGNYQHNLIARQLLYTLEFYKGMKVFPNFHTGWHFDDKIAQTMILKEIGAPIPQNWIFFSKKEALQAIENLPYPVVAKLRKGAGSNNVLLIRDRRHARRYVEKMFSKGIKPEKTKIQILAKGLSDRFKRIMKGRKQSEESIITAYKKTVGADGEKKRGLLATIKEILTKPEYPNEKGYVYFQEFIPGCDGDYRIIVIGNKAYGFKRLVRENDFRASGSGKFEIDHPTIDIEMIKIGFDVARKLRSQCIAFDFLKGPGGYYIVEISYGFVPWKWEGYWNEELEYKTEPPVDPVVEMLKNLLEN